MQDQSGVLDSTLNSMLLTPAVASTSCNRALGRTRPHPSQILKCPRCDSINTKFCYYNNYNLSQPRHFCKTCRRYWTKGGVLRNVPVGGGCRKNNHNRKSKPRNNTSPADKSKSKSNSNSTATVSSSESSPLTVNNNSIQETTSSSTSFNSPTGYRFGSELGEILNGNFGASDQRTAAPIPRLFSGPDYFHQPDFLNSGNLSSNIDANSSSYSSLLGASNYVGLSFSDIQHKLEAFSSNNVQDPCPAAPQIYSLNTNNSCNSYNNSKNSMIPSDWQVNNNTEIFEDSYCWGAEPQAIWPEQEPNYLPECI